MKKAFQPVSLALAFLAASGHAFHTMKQQISTNFAQAAAQHLITVIDGELLPCRDSETNDLIVCPEGQFIWRTIQDGNVDCPCRYQLRHCDNEFEEFDTLTGECVCVERACPDNHFWDFNTCKCECDICHECPPAQDGHEQIWDRSTCSCVCEPEVHPTEPEKYLWNLAECHFECRIQDCPENEIFDANTCSCKCEPVACADGFEWYQDDCQCQCTARNRECPRGQYFDSLSCGCLCEPQECADSYYFDTEICNCVCLEPEGDEACESHQYWDNQQCRCECNPAVADTCLPGEYLDVDDCTCKCAPTECDDNMIFNESICACVCCPQVCPDNFFWNSDACECHCSPVDCPANHYWNGDHCNCDCDIQTDCATQNSINYYFDAEECECKCYEHVDGCDVDEVFDTELCECVCAPEPCEAGLAWSVEHCRCVCQPEICPLTQYFRTDIDDPTLCGCFCKPHFCNVGYHWDENICNCVCSPPTGDYACTEGYYWDSISCRCRCLPLDCSSVTPYSVYDVESESCKCIENPAVPCTGNSYFDTHTCSCLCSPDGPCEDGHYWDTRVCGCLPEHCQCPVGFYYSIETDNCECLTQICASGYEFNTHTCACQHENIPCPDIDGVSYFFDPSSGVCRCYAPGTPAPEGQIWDMVACAFVDCRECDEGYYFDVEAGQCLCKFQAPYTLNGVVMTFNTDNCAFECAAQECLNDSYYWDNEQCKCACYIQDCEANFEWDHERCMCVCAGVPVHTRTDSFGNIYSIRECPCGTFWDEVCCECRACVDQGLCANDQYYNPVECRCECLPQCCDEQPGTTWNPQSCACEEQCPALPACPGEQVKNAFPDCSCACPAVTCADGEIQDNLSCQCVSV